jgi:hypothetical protein
MIRRAAMVITLLLVGMAAAAPVTQGHATVDDCAPGNPLTSQAEMFATTNTETIADPADPRLQDRLEPFASYVDTTILANAALPVGSDLVQRFHNALAADPDARSRLGGGSIKRGRLTGARGRI